MTCREFVEFLMSFVEDELAEEPRREFERHVDECPDCLHYLDSYRETVRLGKTLCEDPDGPPPEDAPEALVQAILAARRKA